MYLPERMPAGGAEFLRALASRGPLTIVVGATGVDEADRPVAAALETAGSLSLDTRRRAPPMRRGTGGMHESNRDACSLLGDPKQSIYRFRRAEIEVFLTTRDRLGGSVHRLTTNFRTSAPVLRLGEPRFGRLIVEPGSQPAMSMMTRVGPTAMADVHTVIGEAQGGDGREGAHGFFFLARDMRRR